jgi:hypothetical protein
MTLILPKLQFSEILQDAINSTGLSVAKFSSQCGIGLPDRFYRSLRPDGVKLGVDSLNAIISRFPELNGDRFIRGTGPILLAELCNESITTIKDAPNKSDDYYNAVLEGKNKEIYRLEKEVEFLRDLLRK